MNLKTLPKQKTEIAVIKLLGSLLVTRIDGVGTAGIINDIENTSRIGLKKI